MLGKDCIRLYTGDVRMRDNNGKISCMESTDQIWGDKKLYQTLNVLMFDGIENEVTRVREGKKINIELLRKPKLIIDIYNGIYREIVKTYKNNEIVNEAYRIERMISIKQLEKGFTRSFFSTSQGRYNSYFENKDGIVLFRVIFEDGSIYGDLKKILGHEYLLEEEQEILIPPFTPIKCTIKYEPRREAFYDLNGEPPKAYGEIIVEKKSYINEMIDINKKSQMFEYLTDEIILSKVRNVANHLNNQDNDAGEVNVYCEWKFILQKYIENEFNIILSNREKEVTN